MSKTMFIALAAALTLSAPVAAKSSQLAESKQAAAGKSSERKICRTIAATGSRMGHRVCLTKEQWKKVDEENAS